VLTSANNNSHATTLFCSTLNFLFCIIARIVTNIPAKRNRIPAKPILLPKSSEAICNWAYPNLISGYANDQPAAQKNAQKGAVFLLLKIEFFM
jgi:hypothetical protein